MRTFLLSLAALAAFISFLGFNAEAADSKSKNTDKTVTETVVVGRSTPDMKVLDLRKYDGLSLTMPSLEWGTVDTGIKDTSNGVPVDVAIMGSGKAPTRLADVAVVTAPNNKAKLGDLETWVKTYEIPNFLESYEKHAIQVGETEISKIGIGSISATRLNFNFKAPKGTFQVVVIAFESPSKKWRHAIFVFNNDGSLGDVSPVVVLTTKGLAWQSN